MLCTYVGTFYERSYQNKNKSLTSDFFLYVIQHGGVGEEGLLPNLRDMLSGAFQQTLRALYTVRYVKSLIKLKAMSVNLATHHVNP